MIGDPNFALYKVNLDNCWTEPLVIKITKSSNSLYYIVNYDKKLIDSRETKYSEYRSVVFSFVNKKILSFTPPRSIPFYLFMNKYPEINKNMIVNDAIEGTMISLFYDTAIKKWEIATKGAIDGKYSFYGNATKKQNALTPTPTFYRMFLDAFRANPNEELNDLPFLNYVKKNASYTFVLQHPKNTILFPVKEISLYLVAVYLINEEEIQYIPQTEYERWNEFRNISGIIQFPKKYENIKDYSEMPNYYSEGITGTMITNIETGERAKLISIKYEQLKTSMKVKANVQYLYFCLRRMGKVTEYIDSFPKYKSAFYKVRNEYELFLSNIHSYYLDFYVFDIKIETPNSYYELWCKKIHEEIFLPNINKITKIKITRKIVKDYFQKLEPRELLYIMNYDFR